MRRSVALAFVWLVGCVPQARPFVSLPPGRTVERWVAEAKARLDTAMRTANARTLEAELDPRTTIVIRGRDSIVGSAAVVAALREQYPGVGQPSIFMHADELDLCVDGAYEYMGAIGIAIVASDRAPRYADFRYAAKWESDGTRVRLVRLALQPPESESSARESLCASRAAIEYPQRRLVVTFMPGLLGAQRSAGRAAFGSALGAQGLVVTDPREPVAKGYVNQPASDPWGILAARLRLVGGLALEGYWALDDGVWNAQAVPAAPGIDRISYIEARTRESGGLLSYEWERWRVAAGVATAAVRWRILDMANGVIATPERVVDANPTGTVLLGAYTQPLTGRLIAELRVQHVFGMEAPVPSVGTAPPQRVAMGGTTFGLHLGFTLF
ncbi:MAG: hypothetical protein HY275_02160 [Gemmatimonadetes bacterium]|nr:hypothetical protein [Gemmatimonadota bacterium]